MMSVIGIVSVPILLLSLVFIFFHAKLVRLHNNLINSRESLFLLRCHKLELLLFFAQDLEKIHIGERTFHVETLLASPAQHDCNIPGRANPTPTENVSAHDYVIENILIIERALSSFVFTEEDKTELLDITKEIEDAENMYSRSKEEFERFTCKFPGKQLFIFLAGKSMKQ